MALAGEAKTNVSSKFRVHKTDTGSPEVQVAILSRRIVELTEHFKSHKKITTRAEVCCSWWPVAAGCWITCAAAARNAIRL